MNFSVRFLLLIPLLIFQNIQAHVSEPSFQDSILEMNTTEMSMIDELNEMYVELRNSRSAEVKEICGNNIIKWLADPESQRCFIKHLKNQAEAGGLSSSTEFSEMLIDLESALKEWTKIYSPVKPTAARRQQYERFSTMVCRCANCHIEESENEDDIDERIQKFREEEKAHKEVAKELLIQSGGEALGAGASAAVGIEIVALYESVQATRHFVKGCTEYNKGVTYQHMAEELEQQYAIEEELEDKEWWQFWK